MTIEIRQLVLRAVVEDRRQPAADLQVGSGPERANQHEPSPVKVDPEALRSACAREFQREIRKSRAR